MASLYKKPVFIRDPRTGRRVKTKSKKWWGRYRDASGLEKRVPLAIDRTAAQVMLSEYVRRAERQKAGLVDPTDEHLKKPLSKHVADYKEYLKSKANSPRYIEGTESRIKAVCTGCRFRHIGQIAPTNVANWLRHQREANKFGISTSNDYLIAIKAFCNWLVREDRLLRNPLRHLQRLNADMDIRRSAVSYRRTSCSW